MPSFNKRFFHWALKTGPPALSMIADISCKLVQLTGEHSSTMTIAPIVMAFQRRQLFELSRRWSGAHAARSRAGRERLGISTRPQLRHHPVRFGTSLSG